MSAMKFMLEDIIYQAAEKSKIDAGILMTAYGQMSDTGRLDVITDDSELQRAVVRFALTGE
ncbi:MAG: hypothetical protein K1W17_02605 [Oscillospiraceae bacterium]